MSDNLIIVQDDKILEIIADTITLDPNPPATVPAEDTVQAYSSSVIDPTNTVPGFVERNVIYLVTVGGTAHATFTGIAGRTIQAGTLLIKLGDNNWYQLASGNTIVDGDANLLSDAPVAPFKDGDTYIHTGADGTIGNAGFLNLQGSDVTFGSKVVFSDSNNQWFLYGAPVVADIPTAPTEDEVHLIGVGQEYTDIVQFLESQQYRPKSEYLVRGIIMAGHVLSYPIHITGGNLKNVELMSVDPTVHCTTTSEPIRFVDCLVAPILNFSVTTQQLSTNETMFYYQGCQVPIGAHDIVTAGGAEPRFVYYLERCESYMLSPFNTYHACSDTVIEMVGGSLLLNALTLDIDCRLINTRGRCEIDTVSPAGTKATLTHNVAFPSVWPVLEFSEGTVCSNIKISGPTTQYYATAVASDGAILKNIEIEYDVVSTPLEATNSIAKGIVLSVNDCDIAAVDAREGSDISYSISGAYTGGRIISNNATVSTNKADSVTMSNNSIVKVGLLTTLTGVENSITNNGILLAGNAPTTRGVSPTVLPGNTYDMVLAPHLNHLTIEVVVVVLDTISKNANAYKVLVLDTVNGGASIVQTEMLGAAQHGYSSVSPFTVDIVDGDIVLTVTTINDGATFLEVSHNVINAV